jgi:putative SOS response-associated peptidase YedK
LSQVPEPMLQPYEVSMRVNNPQNDGPELVEPSALAG